MAGHGLQRLASLLPRPAIPVPHEAPGEGLDETGFSSSRDLGPEISDSLLNSAASEPENKCVPTRRGRDLNPGSVFPSKQPPENMGPRGPSIARDLCFQGHGRERSTRSFTFSRFGFFH